MAEEWQKIYSKNGKIMYEGFIKDGRPYGAGTSYYANGKKCQEGIFDEVGLLYGREYYKNGKMRFEGTYMSNRGYGPNYPVFGTCYDEDGNEYFRGELTIRMIGNMSFPLVEKPQCYGTIKPEDHPDFNQLMWHRRVKKPYGKYFVPISGKRARKDFIALLEKNGFVSEGKEECGRESTINSKFPITIDIGRKEYGHIGNITCAAIASKSRKSISADEFLVLYEILNSVVIV